MRANFTGLEGGWGVSQIRCKGTMNKLGFANFFAKKNQKNANRQKMQMSGSDPDAKDKEEGRDAGDREKYPKLHKLQNCATV